MSLGAQQFYDYIVARKKIGGASTPMAKIVVHAHNQLSQTNTWFKAIPQPEASLSQCYYFNIPIINITPYSYLIQ